MKRSEAIEYIGQLLAREGVDKTWNLTFDEFAKEILDTVENFGMTPPNKYVKHENWVDRMRIWGGEALFPLKCQTWDNEEDQ